MGYLWGIFDHQPRHQTVGYFPCAPGCRASERDPRYCTCVCRGINHGILIYGRVERPIVVPRGPMSMLPETEQVPQIAQQEAPLTLPSPRSGPVTVPVTPKAEYERLGRKLGRALKHSMLGYSQKEMNDRIWAGLRYQFNEERTNAIVDQAFTIRQSKDPYANTPELYELYETGELEQAAEHFGSRWVIGKPKKKRSQ